MSLKSADVVLKGWNIIKTKPVKSNNNMVFLTLLKSKKDRDGNNAPGVFIDVLTTKQKLNEIASQGFGPKANNMTHWVDVSCWLSPANEVGKQPLHTLYDMCKHEAQSSNGNFNKGGKGNYNKGNGGNYNKGNYNKGNYTKGANQNYGNNGGGNGQGNYQNNNQCWPNQNANQNANQNWNNQNQNFANNNNGQNGNQNWNNQGNQNSGYDPFANAGHNYNNQDFSEDDLPF